MIQIPGFRTVLRGYDPTEVDRAIGDLCKARDQARAEAADTANSLGKAQAAVSQLEEQLAGYRTRLAKLESAAKVEQQPSFSDIGARIGRMLALAEDEANEVRNRAKAEADRLLEEATAEAEQLRSSAERHSRDEVSKADTEAARILEAAKRQADEIVDYADREALARREEAEAVYEAHRARAASVAAEFEQNLAERRETAEAEFTAQSATHEETIAELLERHGNLEAEAGVMLSGAKDQAAAIVKAAREEAVQHVAAARGTALKVRRETERELQGAIARWDAIHAQLANVRQVLGTLDVSATPLAGKWAEFAGTGDAEGEDESIDLLNGVEHDQDAVPLETEDVELDVDDDIVDDEQKVDVKG